MCGPSSLGAFMITHAGDVAWEGYGMGAGCRALLARVRPLRHAPCAMPRPLKLRFKPSGRVSLFYSTATAASRRRCTAGSALEPQQRCESRCVVVVAVVVTSFPPNLPPRTATAAATLMMSMT